MRDLGQRCKIANWKSYCSSSSWKHECVISNHYPLDTVDLFLNLTTL